MQVDVSSMSAQALAQAYQAPFDRWVRANMVVSLDGNYVGTNETSRDLSSPDDLRVLLLLRALSDVVVVGARTATSEKYSTMRIRPDFQPVSTTPPRLCVVSNSLEFDDKQFQDMAGSRTIFITSRQNHDRWQRRVETLNTFADVIISEHALNAAFIVNALQERSLNQILCEGGPSLLALFAKEHAIDELDVTLAPVVVGTRVAQPPFGLTPSSWHRTLVGTAGEHTFFRFTAVPLR